MVVCEWERLGDGSVFESWWCQSSIAADCSIYKLVLKPPMSRVSRLEANSNPESCFKLNQHFPRITHTFVALPVYNGPTRIRSNKNKRVRRKLPTCFQWRRTARSFANPFHQITKRQGVFRHQTDFLWSPLFYFNVTQLKVLQPGLISQATGSAYIEMERTKIACAV